MATLTVRISDDTRDALQRKADKERQSLSDFVRDRLQDAVFSFRESEETADGPEVPSLSALDRQMLSMLHRILGRVLPEESNDVDGDKDYQLERAEVLERGFTKEYSTEFLGLRPELSIRQSEFVMDVLDMFRIASDSVNELRARGEVLDAEFVRPLEFRGFDRNHGLEGQMSDYVRFLVKNEKWEEQAAFVLGPERGNSHRQMIDVYSRMLSEYREVKQNRARKTGSASHLLSREELEKIAAAQVHPSNR